ncbi:Vacuolar protein sorting 15, partial [Carabus blaptoides fortunei]
MPRIIYDNVIKYSNIALLLKTLKERKEARQAVNASRMPQYNDMPSSLKNLFRRLNSEGMTDNVEDHLLLMANHLKKIHKHKTSADAKHNKLTDGKIEITEQRSTIRSHGAHLAGFHSKADVGGTSPTPPTETQSSSATTDSTANMSLHERSYI